MLEVLREDGASIAVLVLLEAYWDGLWAPCALSAALHLA
jgi:hypothetical protein